MSETKKEPHPGGRPTKYQPIFCEWLIDHMSMGHSFESFPAYAAKRIPRDEWFSRSSCYEWADNEPEFSDAKKIAHDLRLCAVEQTHLGIIKGERQGNIVGSIHLLKSIENGLYGDKQPLNSHVHISANNEVELSKLSSALKTSIAKSLYDKDVNDGVESDD